MSLPAGTHLGSYEILGPLGAGGMGEVYRARDLSLGRDVAIKILPAAFVADPAWRRRFEREARLLASLTHANLATVHRFEAESAPPFLVMELVPGETLGERLARGVLPIEEVLQILRQCAAGLEVAHDAGIIHRDLKPSNIKITPDGTVKILDFGLAKSVREDGDLASFPTITAPQTEDGAIMGTAPYMSPEQARGRPVDRQTDIWALGCVGYEMLSGHRAFPGETPTDTIAAIVRAEPDWAALPEATPARLVDLLKRCLQKDPLRRLRDARDLRLTIEDLQAAGQPPTTVSQLSTGRLVTSSAPRDRRITDMAGWIFGALALLAAVTVWWLDRRRPAEATQWRHFVQLTDQAGLEEDPVISPDGTSIAYARRDRDRLGIFVQRVGGRHPIVVAGDPARDLRWPAFSPDGSQIAFHASGGKGGLFVVGATGESMRRLTDFGFHPTWSPDGGRIAFATEEANSANARFTTSSLWMVDAKGGTPAKLYDGDAVQPAWAPSGARIAFSALDQLGRRHISTLALSGGTPVDMTSSDGTDDHPAWSSDGHLYFASDRGGVMNLWRVAIDETSGRLRSAVEPVTNGVVARADVPSLSKDGSRLVFRSGVASSSPAIASVDLAVGKIGELVPLLERTGLMRANDISSDGRWLALTNQGEEQEDIFICQTDGSNLRRLTDDAYRDRAPRWSPDGSHLTFYSNRGGRGSQVWTINADGSGLTQVSDMDVADLNFPLYSPGADRIAATAIRERQVFLFDLKAPLPIRAGTELPGVYRGDGWLAGTWSPDGRWIAAPVIMAKGVGIYDFHTSSVKYIGGTGLMPVGWLADSRRVVTVTQNRLVILDVESGRHLQEIPLPTSLSTFGQILFSADGKTLVVTQTRADADIWMAQSR